MRVLSTTKPEKVPHVLSVLDLDLLLGRVSTHNAESSAVSFVGLTIH